MRKAVCVGVLLLLASVALLTVPATSGAAVTHPVDFSFGGQELEGESMLPEGVAVNTVTGEIYALDVSPSPTNPNFFAARGIDVFDSTGKLLSTFDGSDSPYGYITSRYAGIAIDNSGGPSQGDVYVIHNNFDPQEYAVDKYSPSGEFLAEIDGSGSGKGSFNEQGNNGVTAISVDAAGDLYVADKNEDGATIFKFGPDGAFISSFDVPAVEWLATITEVSSVAASPSGDRVYVATGHSLRVFEADGTELAPIDFPPEETSAGYPGNPHSINAQTLAVNPENGNLYVGGRLRPTGDAAEGFDTGAILEYSPSGQFLGSSGVPHLAPGAYVAADVSGRLISDKGFNGREIEVYGPPTAAPAVTVEAAKEVGPFTAVVGGTVDPEGTGETSYQVEYAPESEACWNCGEFQHKAPVPPVEVGSGAGPIAVSAELTELEPLTTYYYRIVATNGSGSAYSNTFRFTTDTPLPHLSTGEATSLQPGAATLQGTVNPKSVDMHYRFEYGRTSAYGSRTPLVDAGDGVDTVPVSAEITGLQPNTVYHFRLVGTNSYGSAVGADNAFVTPSAPTIASESALVGTDTASLRAMVNPNRDETTFHFEYGPTLLYGSSAPVPDGSLGAGSGDQIATLQLQGLTPGTNYHFRVVARNRWGTRFGPDREFTTLWPVADDGGEIPRPPGAIDRRGWELVSQAEKNSQQVLGARPPAPGGEKISYNVLGGIPGGVAGGNNPYFAQRNPTGWVTTNALGDRSQLAGGVNYFSGASPDYSRWLVATTQSISNTDTKWLRFGSSGEVDTLLPLSAYDPEMVDNADFAFSEDLSHVYADVLDAFPSDPSHPAGLHEVYELTPPGGPELVSRMPGDDLAASCGVATREDWGIGSIVTQHQVSTDGTRVFFTSKGSRPTKAECFTAPDELYMRDVAAGTTTLISGPPVSGAPDMGSGTLGSSFLQAAADGSWVIYRTPTSLEATDGTDGDDTDQDIYRYDLATHTNTCLTCVVPGADLMSGQANGVAAVVSEDGSHIYFLSHSAYAGAPAGGSGANLYLLHDGTVRFVAKTDGFVGASPFENRSQLTPDGGTLMFDAATPELNEATGSDNGGLNQVYRYDADAETLACLSCPQDGTAAQAPSESQIGIDPGGTSTSMHYRLLTDDGSMVFFTTDQALVRQDVNKAADIYEWHNGELGLITDGVSQSTQPRMVSATPDGHDFFFIDGAQLVAQSQDAAGKLYDARIGGGFPPPPPPSATCKEDSCQGPLLTPPTIPGLSSAEFHGPSNPQAHKRKRKARIHHRRHRRRHHRGARKGKSRSAKHG